MNFKEFRSITAKNSDEYIDTVKKVKEAEYKADLERWSVDEAKVDTGSAEDKATARNKRNTPPGKDSKFDTSVFITRKPGESLDSARTRKRRDAHAAKRGVSEAKVDTGDDVKKTRIEIREGLGRMLHHVVVVVLNMHKHL